jgi:hypothetical protein
VICHLPQQTRFRDAVTAFGDALRSSSFGAKLAVLPSDSYHVTILGGPNDQDRRRYGWPSDIPINTPIAECNRVIGERIARFKMHAELPIRFCLDKEKHWLPSGRADCNLCLQTGTRGSRSVHCAIGWRMKSFGIARQTTIPFGFHISMAYQMGFTAVERQEYQTH